MLEPKLGCYSQSVYRQTGLKKRGRFNDAAQRVWLMAPNIATY